MYWHLPSLYNPANVVGNAQNVFSGTVSANMLCIPKEAQLIINGFVRVGGPDDWWTMMSPTEAQKEYVHGR